MSIFKKAMASIGIGSSKVDTILSTDQARVGEQILGQVKVFGGKTEQKIDKIYLDFMTYYLKENSEGRKVKYNTVIKKTDVVGELLVKPNENYVFDFTFDIPFETPISLHHKNVWFRTGLDIKMAIDPSDKDYITILPHQSVQMVIESMKRIGFNLREVETGYNKRNNKIPFLQEFEFKPNGYGNFNRSLDEVEMIFTIYNDGLEILAEIDRKARGISGFFAEIANLDEHYAKLFIPAQEFNQNVDEILFNFISSNL
jgi:sporulation-control protein